MGANIRSITLSSRLGFDIITHKTIHRIPHPAHSFPNVAHVNIQSQLTYNDINTTVVTSHAPPRSTDLLAITNSIGNASTNHSFITQTIDSAKNILYAGIPIATSIALLHNQATIMLRKEAKKHGNKQLVEKIYRQGDRIIVLDDLVTNFFHVKKWRNIPRKLFQEKHVTKIMLHLCFMLSF